MDTKWKLYRVFDIDVNRWQVSAAGPLLLTKIDGKLVWTRFSHLAHQSSTNYYRSCHPIGVASFQLPISMHERFRSISSSWHSFLFQIFDFDLISAACVQRVDWLLDQTMDVSSSATIVKWESNPIIKNFAQKRFARAHVLNDRKVHESHDAGAN